MPIIPSKPRFQIAFDNANHPSPQAIARATQGASRGMQIAPVSRVIAPAPAPAPAPVVASSASRPAPKLAGSMIDRVHRAKAGCSACGKKVM